MVSMPPMVASHCWLLFLIHCLVIQTVPAGYFPACKIVSLNACIHLIEQGQNQGARGKSLAPSCYRVNFHNTLIAPQSFPPLDIVESVALIMAIKRSVSTLPSAAIRVSIAFIPCSIILIPADNISLKVSVRMAGEQNVIACLSTDKLLDLLLHRFFLHSCWLIIIQ